MPRYFIDKQNQIAILTSPKLINQYLTETIQVGTEMVEIDGQMTEQPKLELVWKELTKEEYDNLQPKEIPIKEPQKTYDELVDEKIRQKYSLSNELAILRQRDTKPNEFNEYNAYCEQCKAEAKQEIAQISK